jgi:hypothetical protein
MTLCRCGDIECEFTPMVGWTYCRPCGEHHRGQECAINSVGQALAPCGCPWSETQSANGCKHAQEVKLDWRSMPPGPERTRAKIEHFGSTYGSDHLFVDTPVYSGDFVTHARATDLLDSFFMGFSVLHPNAAVTVVQDSITFDMGGPSAIGQ